MDTNYSDTIKRWIEYYTRMKFKGYEEISFMTVRQLKRFLLSKGESASTVMKLIDKKDLRSLAESYIFYDNAKIVGLLGLFLFAAVICIISLYYCRYIIVQLCTGFNTWLYSFIYPTLMLLPSIQYAFRKRLVVAFLCLSVCCMFDIYQGYVQLSILLSWILPRYSILNGYLAPTLYFPLSPSLLTSRVSSAYNVNIGPMITLWICRGIKSHFEKWGSQAILESKRT